MTSSELSSSRIALHQAIAGKLLPTVLYPRLISIKNMYWVHRSNGHREKISWIITALMMWGLYSITMKGLHGWSQIAGPEAIHLPALLGALFAGLFAMILLSSCVSAISTLYMSKDIELILSSPIPTNSLLLGKVTEVGIASSWMLGVFAIPLYVSFGDFFRAGALYYLLAPAIGLSILALATLLGTVAAILATAMLPARGGRNVCAMLFVLTLSTLMYALQSGSFITVIQRAQTFIAAHPILAYFRPFHSIGRAIEALLHNRIGATLSVVSVNLVLGSVIWLALTAIFSKLFQETYSRIHSHGAPLNIGSRFGLDWSRLIFPTKAVNLRALITKDFYSFSRDVTHTFQLCLLLIICLLYLCSFKRIEPPTHVGAEALRAWDLLLVLAHISLGSTVVLSICSRFIFPAVSLEGTSFWIVQAAPISTRDFLRAKYSGWILPTLIISATIFSSGSLAIGLEPLVAITTTTCGVLMTHGLVALAVGLGARAARFDWEHVTELTTSSANLLYMLAGLVLIGINLAPIAIMLGAYILFPSRFEDDSALSALFGSGVAVVITLNFIVGRCALRVGAKSLAQPGSRSS